MRAFMNSSIQTTSKNIGARIVASTQSKDGTYSSVSMSSRLPTILKCNSGLLDATSVLSRELAMEPEIASNDNN